MYLKVHITIWHNASLHFWLYIRDLHVLHGPTVGRFSSILNVEPFGSQMTRLFYVNRAKWRGSLEWLRMRITIFFYVTKKTAHARETRKVQDQDLQYTGMTNRPTVHILYLFKRDQWNMSSSYIYINRHSVKAQHVLLYWAGLREFRQS